MQFKNTPKNGLRISIGIFIIIGILLVIAHILPNEGVQIKHGLKINDGEPAILEKICYAIISIFFIAEFIIIRIMCRCKQCGKYISMNVNKKYCPYCSQKLDE